MHDNLGFKYPILQIPVSCNPKNLENIDNLLESIITTSFGHSYMGEIIPETYLGIEKMCMRMREEKEEEKEKEGLKQMDDPTKKAVIPMVTIDELKEKLKEYKTSEFNDGNMIKQALSLLHEWGEIVYFSTPPSLSNVIILDPKFLTKGILADLFKSDPNVASKQ